MQPSLRPSTLVPRGFVVDDVSSDSAGMLITVPAVGKASSCPGCGRTSERIHSRYHRHLADLPMVGKPVRLVVRARRFHCDTVLCGRRIFAERFDAKVLAPWARRTARLDHIVHHLGLALGGRAPTTGALLSSMLETLREEADLAGDTLEKCHRSIGKRLVCVSRVRKVDSQLKITQASDP